MTKKVIVFIVTTVMLASFSSQAQIYSADINRLLERNDTTNPAQHFFIVEQVENQRSVNGKHTVYEIVGINPIAILFTKDSVEFSYPAITATKEKKFKIVDYNETYSLGQNIFTLKVIDTKSKIQISIIIKQGKRRKNSVYDKHEITTKFTYNREY